MKAILSYIEKSKEAVLDALFPAVCVGCGREGNYVCERCTLFLVEAEPLCPRCCVQSVTGETHPQCRRGEGLDGLVSVWEYEGLMKSLMKTVTEGGVTHAIPEAVELAFRRLVEERERCAPFFHTLLASESALSFVPRFSRYERRKGFNQAFLIANSMGQIAGKAPLPLLKKLHDVTLHDNWDRRKRREALDGAFSLEGRGEGKMPSQVILVDDVWQSGVTLQKCAAVLKRGGAEKVWGFTLARVP